MNIYEFLADFTAFFHGIVVIYLLSGLFLSKKKNVPLLYMLPYIPILIIQFIYLATKGKCPLVIIENYFRDKAGLMEYNLGFISHYSQAFLKINIPDSFVSSAIGIIAGIIIFNFIGKYFPKKITV